MNKLRQWRMFISATRGIIKDIRKRIEEEEKKNKANKQRLTNARSAQTSFQSAAELEVESHHVLRCPQIIPARLK